MYMQRLGQIASCCSIDKIDERHHSSYRSVWTMHSETLFPDIPCAKLSSGSIARAHRNQCATGRLMAVTCSCREQPTCAGELLELVEIYTTSIQHDTKVRSSK